MDALKQQLLRIGQQMSGLTASQKMLTASLVVIMIMTMFYWSNYAGSPDKVVLLDQPMSPDEIAQIKTYVSSKNVSYEVLGDRVMVPSDKKFELIADLGYAQLLPRNTEDGFKDIIVKYSNPFDSTSKSDQLWNHSKQMTLGGIISRWPGVKSASVNIDGTRKQSLSRSTLPVASISINLKSGEYPTRKIADAAADLLVGSQAGLARSGVKVLVNGRAVALSEPGENGSGGDNSVLEQRANHEKYWADKILNQIPYIANAYAVVTVDLNTKNSVINEKKVDPKNKVELVRRSMTSSEENGSAEKSGSPGVGANLPATIEGAGPATPSENSLIEKTEVENNTDHGVTSTVTQAPGGDSLPVSAAVHVPEAYFMGVWKTRNPGSSANPTQADLDVLVTEFTPQIRGAVRSATNIRDDSAVSVARYVDVSQPFNASESTNATLASLPSGFGFGAKEIAIGVLAIVSLFMVSMMVRKSTPQPVLQMSDDMRFSHSDAAIPDADTTLTAGPDMAGEVGESGVMLAGHEMSDVELQSQQVIEQVGTMVKENPDAAANLVKRWLTRE
ncbi:MAG: hypothetical protein H7144_09745 [Burkholderiales bacterium]|nr:hypothetical protein [Phycisphaerae bacterium]